MDREKKLLVVTKRLVYFTALSLVGIMILFSVTFIFHQHFFVSFFSFMCGLIGGFVSIQQRLRRISDEELSILSESWTTVLLIPVYGGIFALVLYIILLSGSGMIERYNSTIGSFFPKFTMPVFNNPATTQDIINFISQTIPATGPDFAKLGFWSFVAGFMERLVPQIIKKVIPIKKEDDKEEN